MADVLPSGLSAHSFSTALQDLRKAVGDDHVLTGADALEPYRDPFSFIWNTPDEYLASAAVQPGSAEDVQAVVRIANQYKIPLHPISTGKNQAFGGTAPTVRGAVLIDFKRMNKILAVDDKRNFALVEPGVTYFDLYKHIQEHKLDVWVDPPDDGNESLIASALDHGMGYTSAQFRDHFGSHCGMEVVLPTGEIIRTGMGALPTAESWQDFKYGVGPSVDGLFGQSNFGIVTKMGFWLKPQPEAWLTCLCAIPSYTDIEAMIETVSYLEDSQIMNGKPYYYSPPWRPFEGAFPSAAPKSDLKDLMANGWPDAEAIRIHARHHGGPAWHCVLQFYGPEKTIRANYEYAEARLRKAIPGATISNVNVQTLPLNDDQMTIRTLVDVGIPNLAVFTRTAAENAAIELHAPFQTQVDFMAVIPRTAEAILKAQRVLYDTQKQMGVPVTEHPFHAPTAFHHRAFMMGVPTVALFKGDPDQNKKAKALYEAYVKNMAAAGFAPYRTSPVMQNLVAQQFSFGDHALLRFQKRLKDALDPNGIISPGRYGI